MRRLLLVTLDFPPMRGGVAGYYSGLVGAVPPESLAVVAEPAVGDEEFDAAVPYRVIRKKLLGGTWPKWRGAWLQILAERRVFRFDILLVGQVLPLGYAALTLKTLFRIPYGVFVHGLDVLSARRSPWKRFWAGRVLRGAELVAANSNWTKGRVREFGVGDDRIVVVYPSPGVRQFDEGSIRRFVQHWNLAGKRVILSVGRLVARKGHDMMIEALPDILRAHPDAVWLVVGDGPERERLMRSVSERALADQVIFTGPVSDEELRAAYGTAELFALPTREERDDAEGFGTVFLEAGAAGLPVVAGRGGGVAEAVVDDLTGFLVDPRNPIAIAGAVGRLLADGDLARRMGEAGRKRAMEEFRRDRQADIFLRAVDRVLR